MNKLIRKSVQDLHAYTPGEQPNVKGLIKLNTNENPYPPSPAVKRVLREYSAESLRLYPDPVCTALRERLAEIHGCMPEQLFVGNGSDEVLRLITRACTQQGGAVGAFSPTYSLYPVLAEAEEVDFRPVELAPAFQWREPPENMEATLFFLANPNAPTGVAYAPALVEAFCRRFSGVVVLDEAYADFADGVNGVALAKTQPNVVVCRTLSKSFSLAGLRIGYAIGACDVVAALYKLKDSYNVNRLSQAVALAALEDLAWMQANVRKIVATRERVAAALVERGWEVIASSANFLLSAPPEGSRAEDVFLHLRHRHVLVRYFPGGRTGRYLRISIGTDAEMDAFLAVL